MIRTICIPAAECISHTKSEFYAALRKSLDMSCKIANIATTHCLKQDDLTQDKAPKLYTYPQCKAIPEQSGASFVVASVCRAVEKSYKEDRWQVRHGRRSARSYRSMPWPMLNNESTSTFWLDDASEFLTLEVRLLGDRYKVRLAGGSNYRDQNRALRACMSAMTIKDSKVWIDRSHKCIFGIAVDMPTKPKQPEELQVTISSGIDYLAAMTIPRLQHPFTINADDVKLWKVESIRRNQRWRQARKQGVNRRRLRESSRAFAEKMQRRLKSKTHEIASKLVEKAARVKATSVVIDFTIKSYLQEFPWYDLAIKIKYKAIMAGIDVIEKTQAVIEPDIDKPHIYFAYDPHSERVKIGRTQGGFGRMKTFATTSPDWVCLAVDNHPQNKLVAKEKHYHAMFDNHRVVDRNKAGRELFSAGPVVAWLRAVGWYGNAGNLSQIAQVLDVSSDASRVGHLQADSEHDRSIEPAEVLAECREKAGISGIKTSGPRSDKSNDE